jgi:hypothetical protein
MIAKCGLLKIWLLPLVDDCLLVLKCHFGARVKPEPMMGWLHVKQGHLGKAHNRGLYQVYKERPAQIFIFFIIL